MDSNGIPVLAKPFQSDGYHRGLECRARAIQDAVREALNVLSSPERFVVEGYYFDGRSFPRLANMIGLPLVRVRLIHRRALAKLEVALTPFVQRMFGVQAVRVPHCPICRATWRSTAEQLLDEKTPDMTWGQIAIRLRRATGWRVPTPQVLITHQKWHRRFEKSPITDQQGDNP